MESRSKCRRPSQCLSMAFIPGRMEKRSLVAWGCAGLSRRAVFFISLPDTKLTTIITGRKSGRFSLMLFNGPLPSRSGMLAYVLAIFSGAFLLFQVQPLSGKYILPWFGGGPGVWTTCLLFFQTLLVAGYAYAHALARIFQPRTQVAVHLCALAGA